MTSHLQAMMDSLTYKPVPQKRLADLLNEQQEPFTLDIYNSRRNVKNPSSDCESKGSNQNGSGETLKRSCRCACIKTLRSQNGFRTLRLIINKFISYRKCSINFSRNSRAQRQGDQVHKTAGVTCLSNSEDGAEENFPSKVNHCSPLQSTFGAPQIQNLEAIATKHQCRSIKASKQLILKLLPCNGASLLHKNMGHSLIARKEALSSGRPSMPTKATKNSTFSDSLCNLKFREQKFYPTPASWDIRSASSKNAEDGGVLIQTKQVLLDYATEAIDIHGKQGKRGESIREMLEPDELREIIYKQIRSSRNEPGDHKIITDLIDSDISNTLEEWRHFQKINRDTEIEIGDAILHDIVTEIISLC